MDALNFNATGGIGGGLAQVVSVNQAAQAEAQTNNLKQQLDLREYERKLKQKDDAYTRINMKLDGFQKDIHGELTEGKNELRAYAREQFRIHGVNDETITAVDQAAQSLEGRVTMAVQQKDLVERYRKALERPTAAKHWNIEESLKNIEEFKALSIEERAEYGKPLLVMAEQEFNPYDIPKVLLTPDHRKKGFKSWVMENLANNKSVVEHYQGGLGTAWHSPNEYYNLIERANDWEYKDRQGRSSAVKYNPYGDPSQMPTAQDLTLMDGNEPAVRTYTIGGEDVQATAIVHMFPTKDEHIGKVTYVDENGTRKTGDLGMVRSGQYWQDVNTGEHYLRVTRKSVVKVNPEDIDPREVESELLNQSTWRRLQGFATDEEKKEQIRKELAAKRSKTIEETFDVVLNEEEMRQQKSLRPHLFSAHLAVSRQQAFNNSSSPANAYEQWKKSFSSETKTQSETKTTAKIDTSLLNELLGQ